MEPDIPTAVALAIAVFQEHVGADDDAIHDEIVARGVSPALAVRLLQFLPIAFCRMLLRPMGVKFPDYLMVMGPGGTRVGEYPIEAEPVYVEAAAAAQRELAAGRGGGPFLAIAGRSGAFEAVMELTQNGSKMDSILCSPPILQAQPEPAETSQAAPSPGGWRWPWQRRS